VRRGFRPSDLIAQLFEPGNLLVAAANLLPVAGVLLMGWDTFLLIMLYWLETAVIGFWTIVGLFRTPRGQFESIRSGDQPIAPPALALFVVAHAGIFMGVHFMFVWGIFGSGIGGTNWASRVGGSLSGFVTVIVIATGLWVPLAGLFVTRGIAMLTQPRDSLDITTVLAGLYVRILVMHLTILVGAMLSLLIHHVVGLVLLVVLKTGVDVFMGVILDRVRVAMATAESERMSRFDAYRRKRDD
jgi:hypothetical protein